MMHEARIFFLEFVVTSQHYNKHQEPECITEAPFLKCKMKDDSTGTETYKFPKIKDKSWFFIM
jgi:hypothetical protein